MSSTIMQTLTFITFIVSEKMATKFLPHCKTTWLASQPNTKHNIDLHFSCKSKRNGQKLKTFYKYIIATISAIQQHAASTNNQFTISYC